MQREKSVETVENLGFTRESRLIGEKISDTTRCGVYCFDSPTRQPTRIVVGEQKAKIGQFVPPVSSRRAGASPRICIRLRPLWRAQAGNPPSRWVACRNRRSIFEKSSPRRSRAQTHAANPDRALTQRSTRTHRRTVSEKPTSKTDPNLDQLPDWHRRRRSAFAGPNMSARILLVPVRS